MISFPECRPPRNPPALAATQCKHSVPEECWTLWPPQQFTQFSLAALCSGISSSSSPHLSFAFPLQSPFTPLSLFPPTSFLVLVSPLLLFFLLLFFLSCFHPSTPSPPHPSPLFFPSPCSLISLFFLYFLTTPLVSVFPHFTLQWFHSTAVDCVSCRVQSKDYTGIRMKTGMIETENLHQWCKQ